MTKEFFIGLLVLIIVVLGALLIYKKESPREPSSVATTTPQVTTAPSLEEQAQSVLIALKNNDGAALAELVHPTKGVRFSPYGYISTSTDVVIQAIGLKDIYQSSKKEVWGSFDGSGEPISMTFKDYSKKFVYDVDFLTAPQRATNKVLGQGNTLVNMDAAYPGAAFVEYYFPGFDPQYNGMDWRSLRLVFVQEGSAWYLVGIAHDQWTI